MNVGDINSHLQSFNDYIASRTLYWGDEALLMNRAALINNYGPDFEGELRFDLTSRVAFSAGIEYLSRRSESGYGAVGMDPLQQPVSLPLSDHFFYLESKAEVVSLKLSLYYSIALNPRTNLFLKCGPAYYFSSASLHKSHSAFPLGGTDVPEAHLHYVEIKADKPGFHGGFGLEYRILSFAALVLEVQGRYAKFGNLKAYKYYTWFSTLYEKNGILYIGERDLTGESYGENCPDLIVSQSFPSGSDFRNVREAFLDLSEYSLSIGIRIKIF